MSNGVLGKSMSSANANVTVYTVPALVDFVTFSLNIVNLGATDGHVRVAIGTSAVPSPQDYVEYGATIPGNGGILERTCMLASANENVIVYADSADMAIRVMGLEKAA